MSPKIAGCSITRQLRILAASRQIKVGVKRREPFMHENHKQIERAVVGLVTCAISIDILSTELPRLLPYLIVLAVIFVIVRLVLFHTRKW
jgi:hypothetical protein